MFFEPTDEIFLVFDGNASLKKRLYRTISVLRNSSVQTILVSLLFQMQNVDSKDFVSCLFVSVQYSKEFRK